MQAADRVVADLADGVVGAGVVVAGADEPAAVVVIDRYLVGAAGKPGQDAACFAELVAEVGRYAGRGGGALGFCVSLGQDLLAGRRAAWWQGQSHRGGPGAGQRPLPRQGGPAFAAHFLQALFKDGLDLLAGPDDGGR